MKGFLECKTDGARRLAAVLLLPAVLAAGGCSVANQAIRADFTDYNAIVQFNQAQQLLLNLVRMHYREAPLFLQAGSLTASYDSHGSASVGYSVEAGSSRTTGLGAEYYFATKPTITYTPIEGKAYTTQFMTPISIETFGLLVRSGWPVSRLAQLLVEKITLDGDDVILNDPASATYPRFAAMLRQLQEAEDQGRLRVATEKGSQVVRVAGQTYPVDAWELRSLFDVMFSAAKNTQTPPAYLDRVRLASGNGALSIRSSGSRPDDALVWVEHNGYWYSIANNDVKSKDTFALMMQLARIQASQLSAQPVMTLPVR